MKKSNLPLLALAGLLLAANVAIAADASAGKTREQVLAELAEAQRTGDVPSVVLGGKKMNEVYPNRYPQASAVSGKTREQVLAELTCPQAYLATRS